MVENPGVLNRGLILPNAGGRSPSRLILIQILGWPIWNTSITEVDATTALIEMINPILCILILSKT